MIKELIKSVINRNYNLNCLVYKMYDALRRFRCSLMPEGGGKNQELWRC